MQFNWQTIGEYNSLLQQTVGNNIELWVGKTPLVMPLAHFTLEEKKYTTHLHKHAHYELSCMCQGEMFYQEGGGGAIRRLSANNQRWVLIPPGFEHRRFSREDNAVIFGLAVRLNANGPLARSLLDRIHILDGGPVEGMLVDFWRTIDGNGRFKVEQLRWLLSGILLKLFAENYPNLLGETPVTVPKTNAMEAVDIYIDENLGEEISVDQLARIAKVSRRQLYRLFEQKHGEPVNENIIRRRLQRAAEMLIGSNLSVKEIAALAGFRNLSYFTRQFKEHFILPPAHYRRQRGA